MLDSAIFDVNHSGDSPIGRRKREKYNSQRILCQIKSCHNYPQYDHINSSEFHVSVGSFMSQYHSELQITLTRKSPAI